MSKLDGQPEGISGIELAIFSGKLNSICEEMGYVLQRSSFSPNIKDRLDFSCALFNAKGELLAQAAHIPVHLGSMAYTMLSLASEMHWDEGDVVVLNDPFKGGTHLPDVTVVSPLFLKGVHIGFVANRAHHANIGSASPGSMPLSSSLEEEGLVISPTKLFVKGRLDSVLANTLCAIGLQTDSELPEDFLAQVSANSVGVSRMHEWLSSEHDAHSYFDKGVVALNAYGSRLMCAFVDSLSGKEACFEDVMDGDGFGAKDIKLKVNVSAEAGNLVFDFADTSQQVGGNLNCPISVSAASVYYLVSCLLPEFAPRCHGVFKHVTIRAAKGSLLNAMPGAAVAAGNVETSMRIVDVVQGALLRMGLDLPAASQGTMNNIAMGGRGGSEDDFNSDLSDDLNMVDSWDYYETIAGGMGAHSNGDGLSGVQCHMTNTLNTPVESLELHYPLQIKQYALREGSGGQGDYCGGEGLIREYEFLAPASVTLLTERRRTKPWGVNAESGSVGVNICNMRTLNSKSKLEVVKGDSITLKTPGGGGWSSIC